MGTLVPTVDSEREEGPGTVSREREAAQTWSSQGGRFRPDSGLMATEIWGLGCRAAYPLEGSSRSGVPGRDGDSGWPDIRTFKNRQNFV